MHKMDFCYQLHTGGSYLPMLIHSQVYRYAYFTVKKREDYVHVKGKYQNKKHYLICEYRVNKNKELS